MNIEDILQKIPDYSKDIKLNLNTLFSSQEELQLNQKQFFGVLLATALTTKNQETIEDILAVVSQVLNEAEINGIKSAVIIMAMNNIYYRFTHLVSDKEYKSMPAKLRMNIIANPGMDKTDFEIYCLAVSVINGCGMCMDAHANTLVNSGESKLLVQNVVRIAAIIHALSMTHTVAEV